MGDANLTAFREMLLQRGRGLSTAETARPSPRPPHHRQLQRGRGLSTAETGVVVTGLHPPRRTLQRGRGLSTAETLPSASGADPAPSLQRGRGLSTAETNPLHLVLRPRAIMLQRGRGLSTAETYRPATKWRRESSGFNGAAVFRPRRLGPIADKMLDAASASTGPRSFDRGDTARKTQISGSS